MARGSVRIRLSSDLTTLRDLRRKYVSTIKSLEAGEIGEKEAKAMTTLLNGLRDLVLRSSKHSPVTKSLKKKTSAKLKEWEQNGPH